MNLLSNLNSNQKKLLKNIKNKELFLQIHTNWPSFFSIQIKLISNH